jgi:demethylspheroidene O-methyltransferase
MRVETAREPLAQTLSDRLLTARDRLLSSQRFQRFSMAFPLTRWIAARHARALFDLCAGFVYSQILVACVRLDLFQRLADGPKPLSALAAEVGLSETATERLLLAACALGLVERRRGGGFGLGWLGAALNGQPSVAAMIEHHSVLYKDLADPVTLLRSARGADTGLSRYWPYARAGEAKQLSPASVAEYSALMAASQGFIAEAVLDAYPFHRHTRVLDVGGGEGTFAAAVARRHAALTLTVFDLPAVTERATRCVAATGLAQRLSVIGGDFLKDDLPRGADLVTLVRVIHDHDDAAALRLLRNVADALPPGGVILIAEPLAEERGYERVGHAYFGMYLFVMGSGRSRSAEQLSRLLMDAGFQTPRQVSTSQPMLVGILMATKK